MPQQRRRWEHGDRALCAARMRVLGRLLGGEVDTGEPVSHPVSNKHTLVSKLKRKRQGS